MFDPRIAVEELEKMSLKIFAESSNDASGTSRFQANRDQLSVWREVVRRCEELQAKRDAGLSLDSSTHTNPT